MKKGSKYQQSGFTLIELMATISIVALALLAYVGGNVVIGQNVEVAYERSMAFQDAQRVIEQMRNLAATGTFPANVTSVYPNGGTVTGYSNIPSEQVSVSYVDPAVNPLDATVTVTWMANGLRTSTASLRTLITQRLSS